jgi:predicted membrane channel-forming protein YqfA (hemolysin III family)
MDTDLLLIIGLVVSILAVPSVISAFSESRPPRAAAILFLIGGTLIVIALTQGTTRYTFADLPEVLSRVIARYLN